MSPRGSRSVWKRTSATDAAVRAERARIARELHDSVAQTLYAITLSASRAHALRGRTEAYELQRIANEVVRLADSGQAELRALLGDLRSDALAQRGLTGALTDLAAAMQRRQGTGVRLALSNEPDVPSAIKAALLGIAREAMHNVAKHAGARHVDLVLEADPADIVLLIADDGRGFDPAVSPPGHFGLRSMRERAEAVGGVLELTSAEGHGTQIRVRVARKRSWRCMTWSN
jgi:signal transduction histidine kinase